MRTPHLALSTANSILLSGVIVNGLAFVGVIVSLLLLRAQGLAQRDATLVIAYQDMTAQMADMDRFLLERTLVYARTSLAGENLPALEMNTTACSRSRTSETSTRRAR